jgi:ankyrin repeat protein
LDAVKETLIAERFGAECDEQPATTCDWFIDKALMICCSLGHLHIVTFILSHPDIRLRKQTMEIALTQSCSEGKTSVVKHLMSFEDRCSKNAVQTAFFTSCDRGNNDLVLYFLSLEGDMYIDVHEADNYDRDAFTCACKSGSIDVVKTLLALEGERKINVHDFGENPFLSACVGGHADIVRLLLSLRGDRYINVHEALDDGVYAFMCACQHKQEAVIRLLLTSGRERMPSRWQYEDWYPHEEPYERWVFGPENNPRAARLLAFRSAHKAEEAAEVWIPRCCKEGRPLQLYQSLNTHRGRLAMSAEDMVLHRDAAVENDNAECAAIMNDALTTMHII